MSVADHGQPRRLHWHERDVAWTRYARWIGIFCGGWMACVLNYSVGNMPQLWANTHKLIHLERTALPVLRDPIGHDKRQRLVIVAPTCPPPR